MEQKTEASQAVDEQWIFDLAVQYELPRVGLWGNVEFSSTGLVEFVRAALKAQPAPTEAPNFCARCGKRLHAGSIHTCTPSAPTEAQGEDSARLAHDCIESIASGHGYMDSYESFHCACCGADLDDKEDHSDDCLTIRAQKFLARASAETGGVKP